MTLNMAESSFLPLSPKHLITGIQYLQKDNVIKLHLQQEFSLLYWLFLPDLECAYLWFSKYSFDSTKIILYDQEKTKKVVDWNFKNQNGELDGCRAAKWVGRAGEEEHHQSSSSKWSRSEALVAEAREEHHQSSSSKWSRSEALVAEAREEHHQSSSKMEQVRSIGCRSSRRTSSVFF
jgi:hypothetical protein